eukprot:CAMPEP_0172495250 /NCGR_PEP_ID=MMETSP1066-20121228/65942_1 /TAXON_ID=671091 /ORGANISM="Coscinodiscus wailesii, Strain CCMP2513" /LENGTH=267 /DNA_ID=CAMNT_0013266807 /DNA_START=42 /DNA_END=845 /DNA_ORIENTATION=-
MAYLRASNYFSYWQLAIIVSSLSIKTRLLPTVCTVSAFSILPQYAPSRGDNGAIMTADHDKHSSFKTDNLSPLSTSSSPPSSQPLTQLSMTYRENEDEDDDEEDDEEDDDESTILPKNTVTSCNVLGTALTPCCTNVGGTGIRAGFYRNGYCSACAEDTGRHTVCVQITDEFLDFSKLVGNDLSTPNRRYMFPGLKNGDIWCLSAARFKQALDQGVAPRVFLTASHEKSLDFVPLEVLKEYAIDRDEAEEILERLNKQREKLDRLLD